MKAFRLVVLAGCFVAALLLLFAARAAPYPESVYFLIPGALFAMAAVYLLAAPAPGAGDGRLRRMFRLWLDAKEAELKKRANPGD
jgi:hypothetical protein